MTTDSVVSSRLGAALLAATNSVVGPDFGAVTGSGLHPIIGALLTIALVVAVAMLVVCAFVWAVASAVGSWQVTAKARIGVLVAVTGGVVTGGALAWTNWLIDLGATL